MDKPIQRGHFAAYVMPVIAIMLTGAVIYGAILGQISWDAILVLFGIIIRHYFKRKEEE